MPPNGGSSAGSSASISISVAGLAASEDMGASAPESGGSIAMSSCALIGGGGGAEEAEERWEGAAVSGKTVGVATVGAVTSSDV